MEIKEEQRLSEYTTFKMGGKVKRVYFPECLEDLEEIENTDEKAFKYIIGGGSNLLINDDREFHSAVCTKRLNSTIKYEGMDKYYIGASVSCQKAIDTIAEREHGGMEYLYSVPGTIGGAIYMNAGRGKVYEKSISDYILDVDYYKDGKLHTMEAKECNFDYRMSVFQKMNNIVIFGARFQFPHMKNIDIKKNIKERLELCRKNQDTSAPNMGSVFSEYDVDIMKMVRGANKNRGIVYSEKTMNWLLNKGGTFEEAISEIEKAQSIHMLHNKKCSLEIKIWD